MLDIRRIREEADAIRAGALKKHFPARAEAVDRLLALDEELRALIPEIDGLRNEQKTAAKQIGKLSPEEREKHLEVQKELKGRIQSLEEKEKELKHAVLDQQLLIPNLPDPEVPEGKDDTSNEEVRRIGETKDSPSWLKAHDDLAIERGWLDVERAVSMAGSRNYMLLGDLVLLQDAVLRLAIDHLIGKGFTPVDPPLLVRDDVMQGTGFFPGGEDQTYRVPEDTLNLIGTAEVPVTSIHAGEILDGKELPKKYVARSMCFRREAGTYGKDTKGLYRVHQFQKVEQVIVDVADVERSKAHHEEITRNSEEVLEMLELPYRVVAVCGGDLGVPQAFKYDIECWMPSRGAYGETHSASRFYDYQARRLNLRYRAEGAKKPLVCHTLNNTVLASPRILIPILEVHQQENGTIRVPEALRPYLGGRSEL